MIVKVAAGFRGRILAHLCSSVEHEREIMTEKPPRAVMRVADLFAKRGSNQKEMSSPGAGSVAAKKTAGFTEPCGFY